MNWVIWTAIISGVILILGIVGFLIWDKRDYEEKIRLHHKYDLNGRINK